MRVIPSIAVQASMSLRARLILAIVVLVTLISTVFALALWQIKTRMEAVAFSHMAEDQLNLLLNAADDPATLDMQLLNRWRLYTGDSLQQMPEAFVALPEGSHHSVIVGDRYFQVQVNQHNGDLAVLSYDITDWENQEHLVVFLLVPGVALVFLVAVMTAFRASAQVLAPLRQLTERIAGIQPQQRSVRLGDEFTGNEIGQIAHAFDSYQERLDGFVAREKYFTTAASHELRTPLSVVVGAVEILEAQPPKIQWSASAQRAIDRIKRATQDMLGFIEVSLLLAREEARPQSSEEAITVLPLVEHIVEELRSQLNERHTRVLIDEQAPLTVQQPASLIQMVISNVLRNAVEHTHNGTITVRLLTDAVEVVDTGAGIASENLQRVFEHSFSTKAQGTGLGLNLVKRLCERLNWQIELHSEPGVGTQVRLTFHH